MRPLLNYEPPMNERCQHRPIRWGSHQRAPVHAWCSPYQGPGIDISWTPSTHLPERQTTKEHPPKSSLLHISPPTQHTGAHIPQQPTVRVSDRSGTPQGCNQPEEYSGERDPEALRGGTPKTQRDSNRTQSRSAFALTIKPLALRLPFTLNSKSARLSH